MTLLDERDAATLNARRARLLIHGLCEAGLREVVLCPGSRNTPLILACDAAEKRGVLRLHTVIDERAAGFVALGLARASGEPAAVMVTSGSAAANLYPAVVEAEASGVGLLLISADRPRELQHCGAPQTFDQRRLFGEHCRAFYDLGEAGQSASWVVTLATRAAHEARRGPVQLNAPFRKPLWCAEAFDAVNTESVDAPTPRITCGSERLHAAQIEALAARLSASERGLLYVGPVDGVAVEHPRQIEALRRELPRLATALGWPLVAEAASQLRYGHEHAELSLAPDALFRSLEGAAPGEHTLPTCLLRFGAPPTHASSQRFFQRLGPRQLVVETEARWRDPQQSLAELIVADAGHLVTELVTSLERRGHEPAESTLSWREHLSAKASKADTALTEFMDESDHLWEAPLCRALVDVLPADALLHLASSSAIRDLDSFVPCAPDGPRRVLVSRGLNGIDGTLATAAGETLASGQRGALLVGDLAFSHDAGGLLAAAQLDVDLLVVVADNSGGRIFEQLPIAAKEPQESFQRHFVTPQQVDLEALCAAGREVVYHPVDTRAALPEVLAEAWSRRGLRVVHVRIDPDVGRRGRTELWRQVCDA